jgi:hypothetical protein
LVVDEEDQNAGDDCESDELNARSDYSAGHDEVSGRSATYDLEEEKYRETVAQCRRHGIRRSNQ